MNIVSIIFGLKIKVQFVYEENAIFLTERDYFLALVVITPIFQFVLVSVQVDD